MLRKTLLSVIPPRFWRGGPIGWLAVWLGCLGGIGMLGCGRDTSTNPGTAEQFWALTLNVHVATISTVAPYDTIRLSVIPRDGLGAPISGAPPARFEVADDRGVVTVDTTGLVTARQSTLGSPATIRVRQTARGVTHIDSVFIQVTSVVPTSPLGALTLSLPPSVGTHISCCGTDVGLVATAIDASGVPIPDALMAFESSDSSIASFDRGQLFAGKPGVVTIRATTTMYGITKHASIDITLGWPTRAGVLIYFRTPIGSHTSVANFTPGLLTLSKGAVVDWHNERNSQSVDIVFDDSTHVEAVPDSLNELAFLNQLFPGLHLGDQPGNMLILALDELSVPPRPGFNRRYFPRAGTYHYHSRRFPNATGTLVIQ